MLLFLPDSLLISIQIDANKADCRPGVLRKIQEIVNMKSRRIMIALFALALVLITLIFFILTEYYLQPH